MGSPERESIAGREWCVHLPCRRARSRQHDRSHDRVHGKRTAPKLLGGGTMHRTNHAHVRQGARLGMLLLVMVASALAAGTAGAGSNGRKGTVGATELQIPVGPRSTALGGAVASDVDGIEAMFWNPAGLATNAGTEAMFSNTQYFAKMKLYYAGV